MTDSKIRALAITGPTASGKTALGIALAREISAEIISADSMQIYKAMDIGTAKPKKEERAAVPHHMIDLLSPGEKYSAEAYKKDAMHLAREIIMRGKIPLFVGGTGLYIDTLCRRGTGNLVPESSEEYKTSALEKIKTPEKVHALWEYLKSFDPESAEAIHENNVRRVLRAVEIYEKTGKTKSYFDTIGRERDPEIDLLVITLDFHNRDILYERINRRVDAMIEEGLLAETRSLYDMGILTKDNTASQAIGYKELLPYFEGHGTLADAVEKIKTETRRYAKRQLTWYRNKDAVRVYMDGEDGKIREPSDILSECLSLVKEFLNN